MTSAFDSCSLRAHDGSRCQFDPSEVGAPPITFLNNLNQCFALGLNCPAHRLPLPTRNPALAQPIQRGLDPPFHPGFEHGDEDSFPSFIENVAFSMRVPLDDPEWFDRWRDQWQARGEPDIFSIPPQEENIIPSAEENVGVGPPVHEDGSRPLEEVAPPLGARNAEGGDAERAGAEGQPASLGSSGQSDAERASKGRGGRVRAPGRNPSAAGGARVRKPPTPEEKATETVPEETEADNPAFDELPSITELETAKINVPDTDFARCVRWGRGPS